MHMLESWIEPEIRKRGSDVLYEYWNEKDDHAELREIIKAIDTGGGQTCDIPKVLIELHNAGFVIVKRTTETSKRMG